MVRAFSDSDSLRVRRCDVFRGEREEQAYSCIWRQADHESSHGSKLTVKSLRRSPSKTMVSPTCFAVRVADAKLRNLLGITRSLPSGVRKRT